MAFIRPFSAWRYNTDVVKDIPKQFSPLFDVVSKEQLDELYDLPLNSIFLSLPRSQEEALEKLNEWKQKGILSQDPMPGIYLYYQEFSLFGDSKKYTRKGFICMLRLNEHDIIEHEETMANSVSSRTELLAKTMLNAAPTHGLYEDREFRLESLMDEYMENPLFQYVDYQGVINRIAVVQHKQEIEKFILLLKEKKIYLADGHHRLASSYELRNQIRGENPSLPNDSPSDYHLIYLTNLCGNDLKILPIHRVLQFPDPVRDAAKILGKLRNCFDLVEISHQRSPIFEELRGKKNTFGLIVGARQFLVRLLNEVDPIKDNPLDLPEKVKCLDYTILHYFAFDRSLEIPYHEQRKSNRIEYQKDYSTAVRLAQQDPRRIAFIMNELSMQQVMEVCNSGTIMPPKSTYFYPKVVCGLVFASILENENNSAFDSCFRFTAETGTSD